MKRQQYNAFTLTELLIALGVIAILCAILMPVIFNLMPNQNTIMAKRAFYTVQSVVSELINDDACYPDKTTAAEDADKRIGFDDGFGTPNCLKWNGSYVTTEGSANTKFLTLFKDKLGIDETEYTSNSFSTADGMDWLISTGFVNNKTDGGSATIIVDVNGVRTEPNCSNNNKTYTEIGNPGSCADKTSGFDRFSMTVRGDGRVTINSNDTWAKDAVKIDKNITE